MTYLLHHLLMSTARRVPDRPALVMGRQTTSYRELDELSNRMAQCLQAHGCVRGDRVGIFMNKSIAAYVSIHGILKAGCAYVPLDPRTPPTRLAYIVRDCGIRCVATSSNKFDALAKMCPDDDPITTILVVEGETASEATVRATVVSLEQILAAPATAPCPPTIETDLAYILYTSGSTGTPKGVMISHLNALTFVRWACEALDVREDDRISGHAPLYFDLSIFDIFATFMSGATLFPVPTQLSAFPTRLGDWIEDSAISVWYSVPSILSMMQQQAVLERHSFPALRMILFAGEVFPIKYLRAWMERLPKVAFYNLYGPTETNVITYHRVDELAADQTKPVPIGRACDNMEVFALAEDGSQVRSPGEEGELYGRGSCVALGYWGDAEKTRKSFVADPLRPEINGRAYMTGDIVVLDEEGNYHLVGRRDHLVKSRGYRIELGDIEAALYGHEGVREVAVVPQPDELIGNRIIAFVVPKAGNSLTPEELAQVVAARLPKYMVPESVVFCVELPKTETGKIDRRALLSGGHAPDASRS